MKFKLEDLMSFVIMWRLLAAIQVEEDGRNPSAPSENTEEYCMLESFQPRCLNNEAILMKSAIYGRMRIGRCLTAEEVAAFGDDPRYFGCSADVLPILDRKCSGRTECVIRLSDISTENLKPCFQGLTVYLEVSYECISVADEQRSCTMTVSNAPTHIMASSLSPRICGTKFQPWVIEAPIGQKVSISLFEFSASLSGKVPQRNKLSCLNYGVIVDKAGKRNISVCGGGDRRYTELYASVENTVEIYFSEQEQKENGDNSQEFILKVEAVGCSDLIPPEDAWLKRNDDQIVIGCYSSRQTWHLRCEEEKWIGVFGNCSQVDITVEEPQPNAENWNDGQVLTMIAVGGLTLTICLTVLCTGIVCLRKFSAKDRKHHDYKTLSYQFNSSGVTNQPLQSNSALPVAGDSTRGFGVQQTPMYSVYVGESGVIDIDNTSSFNHHTNA